jgi:hypothetical protein
MAPRIKTFRMSDLENGVSPSNTPSPSAAEVTALLQAWRAGDEHARDRLIPLVYKELHGLAHHYMAGEQPDATLQPPLSSMSCTCGSWTFDESAGRDGHTSLQSART